MAARSRSRRGFLRRAVTSGAVIAAATTAAVATAPPAAADPFCTTTWTGGTGAWSDVTKWSAGTVPTADDYVCVLRVGGGATPVVTLVGSATVGGITLIGATLRVNGTGSVLTTDEFVVERSLVTGSGTVQGTEWGATRFRAARLGGGVTLLTDGSVIFNGDLTFSGGARMKQSWVTAYTTFEGDVTIADQDDDPANHLELRTYGGVVEAGTTVLVDVPFSAPNSSIAVVGTLRLSHYDGLDANGVLGPVGDFTRFQTYADGSVALARPVTTLAPGMVVEGTAALTAPGGGNALTGLTTVAGSLWLQVPWTWAQPLEVSGNLQTTASLKVPGLVVRSGGTVNAYGPSGSQPSLVTPVVQVDAGGSFSATSLSGRVQSAGTNGVTGAQWGALRLSAPAVTNLSLLRSATISRTAKLAGTASVFIPRERDVPPDGGRAVLLTAPGGVTGTFGAVEVTPRWRGTVTLEYTPTQVIAVYHAPA